MQSAAAPANGGSFVEAISASGRFVAFASYASNLVAGDTNKTWDVLVRGRVRGTTERVSVSSSEVEANGESYAGPISADGRFVAFVSAVSNLVSGDTNRTEDVFVRDLLKGTTERMSVSSSGRQANSFSGSAAISADGRFVAFSSPASNLVAGDTNKREDVFVRDRLQGTTERVTSPQVLGERAQPPCAKTVAGPGYLSERQLF